MPGKKSKKTFKLSANLLLGIPTNIAVGPVGFRAALDTNPKGDTNRSYRGLSEDRADSTTIIDGDNPEPSRIVPHERESGTQEPPVVPGTSTTVEICEVEQADRPTSECYRSPPFRSMFIQTTVPLLSRGRRRSRKTV